MRVWIGALLLCLCAWQTHHRAQAWRSDRALWSAARESAPLLARPALNLGVALVKEAQWSDAVPQFIAAAQLADPPSPTLDLRRQAGLALGFLDTVAQPICDRPPAALWCTWW